MDNQIINENWFETMCNHSLDNFPSIRKPVVKHIPITVWSEIFPQKVLSFSEIPYGSEIRNQGGRIYTVITINKGE